MFSFLNVLHSTQPCFLALWCYDGGDTHPYFSLNVFYFDGGIHCQVLFALLVHGAIHPHHCLAGHFVHLRDICIIYMVILLFLEIQREIIKAVLLFTAGIITFILVNYQHPHLKSS